MGDGGWATNSWDKYKKEFEDVFRGLTMMGYAVVFISHETEYTEKDAAGVEITKVRPAVQKSALAIIENMADIYGYAKSFVTADGPVVKLLLRSTDGRISCGSRFKYIAPVIDFNYESLANTLIDAIEKEAAMSNNKFVTDKREEAPKVMTYDFDALMEEFNTIAKDLMEKDSTKYAPYITQAVEHYFGKGRKISEATRDQGELIYLVIQELKEEILNK